MPRITRRPNSGKVSLAHPYQIGVSDGELEGIVKELASWGLDAIECWYPKHTPEQQQFYLELAKKHRLNVPQKGNNSHTARIPSLLHVLAQGGQFRRLDIKIIAQDIEEVEILTVMEG